MTKPTATLEQHRDNGSRVSTNAPRKGWHGKGWLVLSVGLLIAYAIYRLPPRLPPSSLPSPSPIAVSVLTITPTDYPIEITSYGRVQPKRQIELTSEVSGAIQSVSPSFRRGGYFTQGEALIKIDDRDYQADVEIAQANLISAQQRFQEEKALAEAAAEDWERHKASSSRASRAVSALTLRQPQLNTAAANVQSAQAGLKKAQLTLERSRIIAPFTGRIEEIFTNVGQVVTPNQRLAKIHSLNVMEIRLPISQQDWPFMLPLSTTPKVRFVAAERYPRQPHAFSHAVSASPNRPQYRHTSQPVEDSHGNQVSYRNPVWHETTVWHGNIVAVDSVVDSNSQQLHAIAEIPTQSSTNHSPPERAIAVGQYLKAVIQAKTLSKVIVIPTHAILQGRFVYRIANETLQRTSVTIGWQNTKDALITSGLTDGDVVVVSSVGQANSGMPVRILPNTAPPSPTSLSTTSPSTTSPSPTSPSPTSSTPNTTTIPASQP